MFCEVFIDTEMKVHVDRLLASAHKRVMGEIALANLDLNTQMVFIYSLNFNFWGPRAKNDKTFITPVYTLSYILVCHLRSRFSRKRFKKIRLQNNLLSNKVIETRIAHSDWINVSQIQQWMPPASAFRTKYPTASPTMMPPMNKGEIL